MDRPEDVDPAVEKYETEETRVVPLKVDRGVVRSADIGDADLVAQVRAGDHEAFAELYRRHLGAAVALARSLAEVNVADDIVAESFEKLLLRIREGGGPSSAFRPYLLQTVRTVAVDTTRRTRRLVVVDDPEATSGTLPPSDGGLVDSVHERDTLARAFGALPERWQTYLWLSFVEGSDRQEIATILGVNAGGVSALGYRAREGLRRAYLDAHLRHAPTARCAEVWPLLSGSVRGGLSPVQQRHVDEHVETCDYCRAALAELAAVNTGLGALLAPIVLGAAAPAYLAAVSHAGTAAGAAGTAGASAGAAGAGQGAVAAKLLAARPGQDERGRHRRGGRHLDRHAGRPARDRGLPPCLRARHDPAARLLDDHERQPRAAPRAAGGRGDHDHAGLRQREHSRRPDRRPHDRPHPSADGRAHLGAHHRCAHVPADRRSHRPTHRHRHPDHGADRGPHHRPDHRPDHGADHRAHLRAHRRADHRGTDRLQHARRRHSDVRHHRPRPDADRGARPGQRPGRLDGRGRPGLDGDVRARHRPGRADR